ncbi:peptidase [Thiosulfatimonas sediminis]|uniref:Peptidase n=1 Tax=Thiosulfatimonas sediminis TaxID=2675054 RepID=A0A6F8PSY1_9GAMM|nr:SapC family protein [Thiosulfatimonas sediminis]BBP45134.1 peptidase [Thiosulfatimonas sediminis]
MGFIAVSSEKHREFGYAAKQPFKFAAMLDFLPLSYEEITKLNGLFPICFRHVSGRIEFGIPTHFIAANNALVHPGNGKFLLPYVPAVLRRYPFQLAKLSDGKMSLVVAEEADFAKHHGDAIVDAQGALTAKGKQLQEFLVKLNARFEQMQKALQLLAKLQLFKPIRFELPETVDVPARADLLQIDEQKLNALSAQDLLELRDAGALPLIYSNLLNAHLLPRLSQAVEVFAKLNQGVKAEVDLQKMFDDDDTDVLKF